MKAIFLGICANQTATNEGVSILIETDQKILIDAGPGVVRQILRTGRKCTDISHVFITHCHGDHTLGFPYFIWNHFYESLAGVKGPTEINVYTFSSLIDGLLNMLKFCYIIDNYPFKVVFHKVSETEISEFKIGETTVRTLPVNHTTLNFGLRFDWNNKAISYSSDTIYSDEFTALAKNSDLLIHEAFATESLYELSRKVKHSISKDAGMCATNSQSKELALVHYFPPFQEKLNDIVDETKKYFNGKVFYPAELLEYDV